MAIGFVLELCEITSMNMLSMIYVRLALVVNFVLNACVHFHMCIIIVFCMLILRVFVLWSYLRGIPGLWSFWLDLTISLNSG